MHFEGGGLYWWCSYRQQTLKPLQERKLSLQLRAIPACHVAIPVCQQPSFSCQAGVSGAPECTALPRDVPHDLLGPKDGLQVQPLALTPEPLLQDVLEGGKTQQTHYGGNHSAKLPISLKDCIMTAHFRSNQTNLRLDGLIASGQQSNWSQQST